MLSEESSLSPWCRKIFAAAIPPRNSAQSCWLPGLVKDGDTGRVWVEIEARASPDAQRVNMDTFTNDP